MLERLTLPGVKLPRLYVAHSLRESEEAMAAGIPFVRWSGSTESLVKALLRPVLESMFPYIKWDRTLGKRRKFKTHIVKVPGNDEEPTSETHEAFESIPIPEDKSKVTPLDDDESIELDARWPESDGEGEVFEETADIAEDTRYFYNHGCKGEMREFTLEEYVGDLSSSVNLEVLQSLKLLPAFIGDITECIKINLSERVHWTEGFNKKRMAAIGNFNAAGQRRNLMILDVSGSIPRGIAATMIQLIDTLRTETQSDLIITASQSRWYSHESELPDPQTIRDEFGTGNESDEFGQILQEHVVGRQWGHVISFGDNDTPSYQMLMDCHNLDFKGTEVGCVHHYHTGRWGGEGETGYAKWCSDKYLVKQPETEFDTSWAKVIKEGSYW